MRRRHVSMSPAPMRSLSMPPALKRATETEIKRTSLGKIKREKERFQDELMADPTIPEVQQSSVSSSNSGSDVERETTMEEFSKRQKEKIRGRIREQVVTVIKSKETKKNRKKKKKQSKSSNASMEYIRSSSESTPLDPLLTDLGSTASSFMLDPDSPISISMSPPNDTTNIAIPLRQILLRESSMRNFALSQNIPSELWQGSLIYTTLLSSLKLRREEALSLSAIERGSLLASPLNLSISIPNDDTIPDFLPLLKKSLTPYYSTSKIFCPDSVRGPDLLHLLEFFRILYPPTALQFESFGAFLRVRLWGEYFSKRREMANWVIGDIVNGSRVRRGVGFVTSNEKGDFRVRGKRVGVLEGGLGRSEGGEESCAVVHEFFNPQEDHPTTSSLDATLRADFCRFLQSLLPGTLVSFNLVEVTFYKKPQIRPYLYVDFHPPLSDDEDTVFMSVLTDTDDEVMTKTDETAKTSKCSRTSRAVDKSLTKDTLVTNESPMDISSSSATQTASNTLASNSYSRPQNSETPRIQNKSQQLPRTNKWVVEESDKHQVLQTLAETFSWDSNSKTSQQESNFESFASQSQSNMGSLASQSNLGSVGSPHSVISRDTMMTMEHEKGTFGFEPFFNSIANSFSWMLPQGDQPTNYNEIKQPVHSYDVRPCDPMIEYRERQEMELPPENLDDVNAAWLRNVFNPSNYIDDRCCNGREQAMEEVGIEAGATFSSEEEKRVAPARLRGGREKGARMARKPPVCPSPSKGGRFGTIEA